MDHIESFGRHSRYPIFMMNTDCGYPRILSKLNFDVVILHYSLFAGSHYHLSRRHLRYLSESRSSYKIAFFQDEYRFCRKRFGFLNELDIDAVYTLLGPEHHHLVYGSHTSVREVQTTLTGYVSDELIARAQQLFVPDEDRTVDVGYRTRRLPYWMGRGSQEKHEIAEGFCKMAAMYPLVLDIDTTESSRIYGDAWYRFVANCRGLLGVETGTSVFDLDDSARERTEALLAGEPDVSFEDVERRVLHEYEGRIPYRTVGPRHFEAAAFRVCQILYKGRYNDVLEADVHYLALEKDWSNFDNVMRRFSDVGERKRVTDRAYEDLIVSGRWSYSRFVGDLDDRLVLQDLDSTMPIERRQALQQRLVRGARIRQIAAHPKWALRRIRWKARWPW